MNIGDIVRLTWVSPQDEDKGLSIDMQGLYMGDSKYDLCVVSFPDWHNGHNGNFEDVPENDTCWYVSKTSIELVEPAVLDNSNNNHYQTLVQPIECIQANLSPEAFQGYCRGNIIKYACRIGKKDNEVKEAKKIIDYAVFLYLSLIGKTIDPKIHTLGTHIEEVRRRIKYGR